MAAKTRRHPVKVQSFEAFGQVYAWQDIPSGMLFLCKCTRHQFFGMKVSSPEEKCLLLHGQYDLAQKSAAFIAVADVLNESLLSFPNAMVMFDSVVNGILLSQLESPATGDLLLVNGTVNLCVGMHGQNNFVDLATGKLNADTVGALRAIITEWSVILRTDVINDVLFSFPATFANSP
jgi:hypothetical protein